MDLSDNRALASAEEYIQKKQATADASYWKSRYHITPRTGWINDPNGLIYWRGNYHVFYQYYPYAPQWGPMHWGHVVSKDLAHWRHLPVALAPDEDLGQCFSGCAVSAGDEFILMYTAHKDGRSPKEVQCLARSTDGVRFFKDPANPVIARPPVESTEDFRDPKIWHENGLWHAVIGSGRPGRGNVLAYRSADLIHWEYRGVFCTATSSQGTIWECPNFVSFGSTGCLIVSPMHVSPGQTHGKPLYILGKKDRDAFVQQNDQIIDHGSDFYAPQLFFGTQDRVLLLGWFDMWGKEMPTQKDGWAGMLTLPRELTVKENHVYANPVRELKLLRKRQLVSASRRILPGQKETLPVLTGDNLEAHLHIVFDDPLCTGCQCKIRMSPGTPAAATIVYDRKTATLAVYKPDVENKNTPVSSVPIKLLQGNVLDLHIFVDCSSLEVFINNGYAVLSERIYPAETSLSYDLCAKKGGFLLENITAWDLGNIWE